MFEILMVLWCLTTVDFGLDEEEEEEEE